MRRWARGLLAAAAAVLASASPAWAHDCNVFINPEDCKNTAWTVGVTATIAAATAAVTGLVRSGTKGPMPRDEGECGAELRDLDGRLNSVLHAIETSTDRYNRTAMQLEERYASVLDMTPGPSADAALAAARAQRTEIIRAVPAIERMRAEALELHTHRQAVFRHCGARGHLPGGTWDRPAPTFGPLFDLPDYGPGNAPAIDPVGVRRPGSYDDLVSSLTQPGTTIVDPSNAHTLGPPELVGPNRTVKVPDTAPMWARPLDGLPFPPLDIRDGTISVRLGPAGARIAVVNDNGRIGLQGDYEVPFGGGEIQDLKRVKEQLDRINRQMRDAGMQVTDIDTSGGRIRIQTGPIE